MITIVIPCYNEELRLPVEELTAFIVGHSQIKIILVNDGSTDGTLQLLHSISEAHSSVSVLNLEVNSGKAEAVRQGMLQAAKDAETQLIGFFDADLATPLEEVYLLQSAMGPDCQFAFGSRILKVGSTISRKAYRHYMGRIIATGISMILRLDVYDTQCGAKLFRKEVVSTLFEKPFISRWLFDVEIFARLIKLHGNEAPNYLIEIPLRTWIEKGDSKIGMKDVLSIPFELMRIRRAYPRG